MRYMTRKAYAMEEMLVSLFVASVLMLMSLHSYQTAETGHYRFLDSYLKAQKEAYVSKEYRDIEGSLLHFNNSGNISKGETIHFPGHWIITHPGNGYVTYK